MEITETTTEVTTPRRQQIAEDLRAAAERAERALGALNQQHDRCKCCKTKQFHDFREANAADAVKGCIKKLRRWADAVEHPSEYSVRGARDGHTTDED